MSRTFKLRPEAFQYYVRRGTTVAILLTLSFAAAFILLFLWSGHIGLADLVHIDTLTLLLPFLGGALLFFSVVGMITVFFMRASVIAQRAVLHSIELEVADDYIARRQMNSSEIRLQRAEVASLEDIGNSLNVLSTTKYRTLVVPKLLDGYDEVKEILLSWGIPLRSTQQRARISSSALGVLTVVGLLLVIFAFDPQLQAAATLGMIGMMGYFYWDIGRWEGHNPKLRKWYLFLIAFIAVLGTCKLLSIIFTSYTP